MARKPLLDPLDERAERALQLRDEGPHDEADSLAEVRRVERKVRDLVNVRGFTRREVFDHFLNGGDDYRLAEEACNRGEFTERLAANQLARDSGTPISPEA